MKVLVALLAIVALAVADEDDHGCSVLDRLKVKNQWTKAYSSGHAREDFAQAIWRAIFAQAPDARSLFKRVHGEDTNSPEFEAHALRVLGGFDIAIATLDQPEIFKAELEHLQKQHEGRHIPDQYFDNFKNALLHVLPAQLGRCWDKEAWSHCFDLIAHHIKGH